MNDYKASGMRVVFDYGVLRDFTNNCDGDMSVFDVLYQNNWLLKSSGFSIYCDEFVDADNNVKRVFINGSLLHGKDLHRTLRSFGESVIISVPVVYCV